MTTKKDIREYMRDTRESFRLVEEALLMRRFDDAADLATQAAGCAGEVENLVHAYIAERSENRFASGDSGRLP